MAVIALALTVILSNTRSTNKPVAVEQPVATDSIVFSMPVASTTVLKGFSDSELQYNSTLNSWRSHYGVDLSCELGSEVYAVLDGTVKSVTTNQLDGTVVVISHKNGLETVYGSLNQNVNISVGDKVLKGQQLGFIALSATNELNYGPHLHFEVLQDGNNVDPSLYIAVK